MIGEAGKVVIFGKVTHLVAGAGELDLFPLQSFLVALIFAQPAGDGIQEGHEQQGAGEGMQRDGAAAESEQGRFEF